MITTFRQFALALVLLSSSRAAEPPRYVPATAHYILPETTSEQSGYFSLSESLDGSIHVGSAKYGEDECTLAAGLAIRQTSRVVSL